MERGRQDPDLYLALGRQVARRQAVHGRRREVHHLLQGNAPENFKVNFRKGWYANAENVTVNGESEAVFKLKAPQPALLGLLALGFSPMYPCHVSPREMRQAPISTGPFKFVECKPNQTIKVARNPNYWKPGKPYLDGVEYIIIPNRSTAILAFQSNRFDMATKGFGPNKPLKVKVSTRNLPTYRDASVVLISRFKEIHIDGELQLVDTAQWVPKLIRRDYVIGVSQVGNGVDDPDQNYYENYACGSRTYMDYCNKDVDAMIAAQSVERDPEKRRKIAWEIDKKLTNEAVRPMLYYMYGVTCWQPGLKGVNIHVNSIYNNWRLDDVWLE